MGRGFEGLLCYWELSIKDVHRTSLVQVIFAFAIGCNVSFRASRGKGTSGILGDARGYSGMLVVSLKGINQGFSGKGYFGDTRGCSGILGSTSGMLGDARRLT